MTSRKHAVSIRMSATDIGSVKKMAKRLGVRDSDVIRSAVKMMMSKFGPLADSTVRGRSLVPVFVEAGGDLFRHFDLDAIRLENIINDGVADENCVDHDDIQMIAMNGVQRSFIKLRLSAIDSDLQRDIDTGYRDGHRVDDSLRRYLYEKYVYRVNGGTSADEALQKIGVKT